MAEKLVDGLLEQIQKISEEMCDKFCKFQAEANEKANGDFSDELFDRLNEEHCKDCPLNKL